MMSHARLTKQHQVKPCTNAGRSHQVGTVTQAGNVVGFWETAKETQKSVKLLKSEF